MSISQVGLPKELNSGVIDYSLPPNVNSYPVKVVPSNTSSVQSATQTLTASQYQDKLNNVVNNVIFDVPAGQSKSTYIDHRFSTLSFRAQYEVVSAGSTQIVSSAYLRSNCMSFFDRTYTESQSGVLLDDINNLGLVCDTLLQLEMDVASRDANALMYGLAYEDSGTSSANKNTGHSIPKFVNATAITAGSEYHQYCVPLFNSLIGRNASKFFNIGSTSKLRVVFTTSATLPITILTGTATTAATIRITLDNFALNLQYIDVGSEGMKLLNRGGLQYYNAITYRTSSNTLPSSAGAVSLLTGLKGSSVRSIITRFTENKTDANTGCVNGIYDSKLPQATSINYNINGMRIPSNPVNLIREPANAFAYLQEANESFNNYQFRSGIIPTQYCVYVPGGTLDTTADQAISVAGSGTKADSLASFMYGYNLEKISKHGILDGMNLNASSNFLEMITANASSNTITVYFISKLDIIFVLDENSGEITVRM